MSKKDILLTKFNHKDISIKTNILFIYQNNIVFIVEII